MNLVQKIKHCNLFWYSFIFVGISIFFTSSCNLISDFSRYITITEVIDGDTFNSLNDRYRILGIDTPETYDSNNNFQPTSGPQYFYGTKAKEHAKRILSNRQVEVEIIKKDKYNRNIVKVNLDYDLDFGSYMIRNGYAIVRYISSNKNSPFYFSDINYINNLYSLENEAKQNKLGFWSEPETIFKKIFP